MLKKNALYLSHWERSKSAQTISGEGNACHSSLTRLAGSPTSPIGRGVLFCLLLTGFWLLASGAHADEATTEAGKEAAELLMRAKQGDSGAAFQYGKRLRRGLPGQAPDLKGAIYWLQRAAQQSNPDAAILLARSYQGKGIIPPTPTASHDMFRYALRLLRQAADEGDSSAMAKIGQLYAEGTLTKKNPKRALHWLEKAIAAGSPQAKLILGRMAIWGFTPGYTEEMSLTLLQEAADAGVADAWLQIGLAYSGAFGGTVNHRRAFYAFTQSVALGSREGLRQMGLCYLSGLGVHKNAEKGVSYLRRAAEGYNSEAMYNLALAYRMGVGTVKDNGKYIEWLTRAAANDHPDADYLLGIAYRDGDGVSANRDEAIRRLQAAKNKSHVLAIRALEGMIPTVVPVVPAKPL